MTDCLAICLLAVTTAFCAGALVGYKKAHAEINKVLLDKFGYILNKEGKDDGGN